MPMDRICRCGSVVEHSIRNRAVAGSNPAIGFDQIGVWSLESGVTIQNQRT